MAAADFQFQVIICFMNERPKQLNLATASEQAPLFIDYQLVSSFFHSFILFKISRKFLAE